MAFPLKSGADLYNQQLIRAAIWNYSAEILDPKEYVTGLMYFNTNSGSNLYQKLRFRTGTEWKTIAFEEDLDVANNAEFKALEDKVKLLAGEVDTDAIISNMKEVSNFLAGFAEDAKLMDVLSNVPKALFTNDLNPLNYTSRPLFITAFRIDEGTTADYGTLIVPTWSGNSAEKYYLSELRFPLGVAPQFRTSFNGEASDWKTIAFTDSNVASATKLETPRTIWGQSFDGTGNVNGVFYDVSGIEFLNPVSYNYLIIGQGFAKIGMSTYLDGNNVYLRYGTAPTIGFTLNSSGNVTIGASDLAGTIYRLYVDGDTKCKAVSLFDTDSLMNGYLLIVDNCLKIEATKDNEGYKPISLNPLGGNVLIGTTEDNGAKLQVSGNMTLGYYKIGFGGSVDMYHIGWGNSNMFSYNNHYGHYFSTNNGIERLRITQGGNVGIGLTNPSAQLHVAQDIVANGTIACKGIAAEGDAMDVVDKTVLYIIPNGTQQTFTLNHGLGTREITISIYEITSMGTNMILTDVEIVDDNNISVSFGNPPTENHMVVVMG